MPHAPDAYVWLFGAVLVAASAAVTLLWQWSRSQRAVTRCRQTVPPRASSTLAHLPPTNGAAWLLYTYSDDGRGRRSPLSHEEITQQLDTAIRNLDQLS